MWASHWCILLVYPLTPQTTLGIKLCEHRIIDAETEAQRGSVWLRAT